MAGWSDCKVLLSGEINKLAYEDKIYARKERIGIGWGTSDSKTPRSRKKMTKKDDEEVVFFRFI